MRFESKSRSILYNTIVAVVLICVIFAALMVFFHNEAENIAYDELHAEATYIRNDLSVRIKADRNNLVNMANFAAALYEDGRAYSVLLDSFEPIGLVSTIGILNRDNIFVTKLGSIDLSGKISFEDEAKKGEYISGRMTDLTIGEKEIIRCAVPIVSGGETVGILYGGISVEAISEKYEEYVKDINARLFVYDKETGKFIVDTLDETPGNLAMFSNRKYNGNHSFDEFITKERGFSSFSSELRNENIYVYFTKLGGDVNWGVILGRYESVLFAQMYVMTRAMILSLLAMLIVISVYFLTFEIREKRKRRAVNIASEIKKLLLEINQKPQNITKSLRIISEACEARSAVFIDERGDIYDHVVVNSDNKTLADEYRKQFKAELFRYAAETESENRNTRVIDISTDRKLLDKNGELYSFFKNHGVKNVIFLVIGYNDNNGIIGVVNPKNKYFAQYLINEIDASFLIAIYNKNYLNRTRMEAFTDTLTGIPNRSSYEKDLSELCKQNLSDATCIYIDVNGLHIVNNTYGHAAGDEMLVNIANVIRKTFTGGKVYRIGGDEFLIFVQNESQEAVKNNIDVFFAELERTDYKVAMGVSYRRRNGDMRKMVKEAEERMYDSKARYYQNKMQTSVYSDNDICYMEGSVEKWETGVILSAIREHFSGILRISLEKDTSEIILANAYPVNYQDDKNFSKRFGKYVDEAIHPDFHREVLSFLNYDVLRKQLAEGHVPSISYKKLNGETVTLSVYNSAGNRDGIDKTLWFFAKE